VSEQPTIDWDLLHAKATEAMHQAYAPYSNFPVGVAALVDDGRVVSGCNVENASYGLALCAECGMISQLHLTGGGHLVAVTCVNAQSTPLMPCGRCRQLLWENAPPTAQLMTPKGIETLAALLPQAFGPTDLGSLPAPTPRI